MFDMGSQASLDYAMFMDMNMSPSNGNEMLYNDGAEADNRCDHILGDLESYLDDIQERVTISRMVNESVIKGMVRGIQQEAAEVIAQKDSEIFKLKEMLHFDCMVWGKHENHSYSEESLRKGMDKIEMISDCSTVSEDFSESYEILKMRAAGQLDKLKQKLKMIKGSGLCQRCLSTELVCQEDVVEGNDHPNWIDVEEMLERLGHCLQTFCRSGEDLTSSNLSLYVFQQERQFLDLVEGAIIKICVSSAQEETLTRLQGHHTRYGYASVKDGHKMKEISKLREELDGISKLLVLSESVSEFSPFASDRQNVSANTHKTTNSRLKENGNHIPPAVTMHEGLDSEHLKDFSADQLITHFKTEMMKMIRHYEQQIQNVTEEMFCLKRDYMKEVPLQTRKCKGYEVLGGKVPEILQSLQVILDESEKWASLSHDMQNLNHANERFNSLISENRQLKEMLAEKTKEVHFLSSKVSDLTDKLSMHFKAESKLIKDVRHVKQEKEEVYTENSISEDIFKIIVNEIISQLKSCNEDLGSVHVVLPEPYHEGNVELFSQGLCEVLFNEAWKDAKEKIAQLILDYDREIAYRMSLETELLRKERVLNSNAAEKEIAKQEFLALLARIDEKDELIKDLRHSLREVTVKLEKASDELSRSRLLRNQLENIVSTYCEEMQIKFVETMIEDQLQKCEISQLRKSLDCVTKRFHSASEERRTLLSEIERQTWTLSQCKEKENECQKQLYLLAQVIDEFSGRITSFERLSAENIKRNHLRLKILDCDLNTLGVNANLVRNVGIAYKEKLERKISDLHKAEIEVDLLGDEVDALFNLLEKIYIALDHYSPVLVHYPGITEILKLVRRKLCGEGPKLAD